MRPFALAFTLLASTFGLLSVPVAAFADDASCEKRGALICAPKTSLTQGMSIIAPLGDVTLLRDAKLISVTGDGLAKSGDRILVGRGDVRLGIGAACQVRVPQNASAILVGSQERDCVLLDDVAVTGSISDPLIPSSDDNPVATALVIAADTVIFSRILGSMLSQNDAGGLSP